MAISHRGTGAYAGNTSTPNPSYTSGVASQDLNLLFLQSREEGGGWSPVSNPNTPSGYTKICRVDAGFSGMHTWVYYRIGSFSGSIGAFSWTGGNPDNAAAWISTFTCGASETWDTASWGTNGVNGPGGISKCTWSYGSDTGTNTSITCQAFAAGTNGAGRIDPATTDLIYCALQIDNYTNTTNETFYAGSGQTNGTQTVLQDVGSLNGSGPFQSWAGIRAITAVSPPYGAPKFTGNTGYPSNEYALFFKIAITQKTSTDTRTVIDLTQSSGLTSADTSPVVTEAHSLRTGTLVPAGRTWVNDEVPKVSTSTDPNTWWRDPLRWLLGYSSPGIMLTSTVNVLINGGSTWYKINFDQESYKIGGMTHSNVTNNTRITVPEDGWYTGSWSITLDTDLSQAAESRQLALLKNGSTTDPNILGRKTTMPRYADNGMGLMCAFNVYLLAGDYVEPAIWTSGASGHTDLDPTQSVLTMWWSSK